MTPGTLNYRQRQILLAAQAARIRARRAERIRRMLAGLRAPDYFQHNARH